MATQEHRGLAGVQGMRNSRLHQGLWCGVRRLLLGAVHRVRVVQRRDEQDAQERRRRVDHRARNLEVANQKVQCPKPIQHCTSAQAKLSRVDRSQSPLSCMCMKYRVVLAEAAQRHGGHAQRHRQHQPEAQYGLRQCTPQWRVSVDEDRGRAADVTDCKTSSC